MKKLPIADIAPDLPSSARAPATGTRPRPTKAEAEAAVRTLLAWAGDDPDREGLRLTPQRVVDAYREYFSGYGQDALALLDDPVVDDVSGYDDMVLLKDVPLISHCEHHIAPFMGKAFIAYMPGRRVTGLSRLARVVDIYARRLQTQEALTAEIAAALEMGLQPRGVAILMEAEHQCVAARGIRQHGLTAVTMRFTGVFGTDTALQTRFLRLCGR